MVYITVFDLNKIIPEDNFNLYKNSLKKYPSNRDLKQIYWERKHWEEYRREMVENIRIDK